MSIQIPTPNITASNDRERLQQMQSYLYRMAQQLQWAFDTLETGSNAVSQTRILPSQNAQKVASQDTTFAGLKDLIIKSADIVNAYYVQISKRLEGKYVAQSDFGTYTEQTSQEIQENSSNINQLFTNVRTLSDTVDEMYNSTLSTNAYIKTGLLAEKEDGTPIYGLEVGQTNSADGVQFFDKFARFTADRLSFYDRNDIEVAYISDYHLHITNASISGTLTLMDQFEISCDSASVDFNWMGG
jgi:uncharacterized protein YoxC